MSFGLCHAVATFQRLMETVLRGLHWKTCLLYIDDIIVFADNFDTHIQRLDEVLARLAKAGLKISPKKCHFFQKQVKEVGPISPEICSLRRPICEMFINMYFIQYSISIMTF